MAAKTRSVPTRNASHSAGEPRNVFPNRFFRGRIDEVALFDRALSVDEIAAKPRAGKGTEPGLVAAYRLEGTVVDLKGKHEGLLEGGAKLGQPGAPLEP